MSDEVVQQSPEKKEQGAITPDVFSEKKDLTHLQAKVETTNLKTEIIDKSEVKTDWTYELIRGSIMEKKLKEIGKSDLEIKEFAENIDKTVRKYLDQELNWFSNAIKNSMSVGIQFAMMEALTKQWAQWAAEFFTAFSATKTNSWTNAFEWLYKAFGKVWKVNEFFVLANKVQNITRYLADKKSVITAWTNIPELMNPAKFKLLLNKPVWSNQAQIDKLDITKLLTLDSKTSVELTDKEKEDLKKIVNNPKIPITKETIASIEKSLKTADKLLDTRGKFKDKASDLVDKIASFLDIDIPFFGNLGEMIWMEFPTDLLGEKKDGGVLNFVLGVLWFRGGVKWLHREYIREKLDDLDIDNEFVKKTYADYQKNIDATITNDWDKSTWKICALSASPTTEASIKAKIPADYAGLKKSITDNLASSHLNAVMVAKFAPEFLTPENNVNSVDMAKVKGNEDAFVETYLKYIIPLLADPSDNFITSKQVDKDSFALAVLWGLVGDKYFIEWINIWLVTSTDFKSSVAPLPPVETPQEKSPELTKLQLKNKIQAELTKNKSPLTAEMIIQASEVYKIPVEYIMAFMKNDSSYGTAGVGASTYNPGNVGNTNSGSTRNYFYKNFKNWETAGSPEAARQAWVDAVAKHLRERTDAYHAKYGNDQVPSLKELASGKQEKTGETYFGVYMTAKNWPASVQTIGDQLVADNISNKEQVS